MRFPTTLALLAVIAAPALAHAQGGPMQGACKPDIQSLCGSVQPGGGRIRDCMREHRAQLSAACKVAIADRMLERAGHRGGAGQPGAGQPSAGITAVPPKP
jgi:cysteine rich repeat protein